QGPAGKGGEVPGRGAGDRAPALAAQADQAPEEALEEVIVTFAIPGFLRQWSGGRATVELECSGPTVGAALMTLIAAHPGLRDRIFDDRGAVRRHVNVFLGADNVRDLAGLATPINGIRLTISIFAAISGGAD